MQNANNFEILGNLINNNEKLEGYVFNFNEVLEKSIIDYDFKKYTISLLFIYLLL